jgi:PTEN phosphatase family protein
LSAAVILVKLVAAESSSLSAADGTTTALRVASRVAMALRLLRIIISIRKARKFSGKVQRRLRLLISQNRRRYRRHGFDLDVTYITNRVMAMSAPSFGATSTYRNDIHVVARFLSYMHYGHFFVFNLCDTYNSSDGLIGQYHAGMIFQQVPVFPF